VKTNLAIVSYPEEQKRVRVNHDTCCVGHSFYDLFGKCWAEMIAGNMVDRYTIPFHSSFEAIWIETAEQHTEPIGFILFSVSDNEAWVRLSYVDEPHRRRGHYRLMFDALKSEARKRGCTRVCGGTSVRNVAMQEAYIKTGRNQMATMWEFPLD
jgi:GNAT superfamily N-acetyltransferase